MTAGANLGWNVWEGSFTYGAREVGTANQRGDAKVTYPVVEFDHRDPLRQRSPVELREIVAEQHDATPRRT